MNPPVFIIAEAGVNHNGRLDLALALVDAAAAAGADAVKFQTFRAEDLVAPGTSTVGYQQQHTGYTDQLQMLRTLELGFEQFQAVAQRCRERGIEFMSTPFSEAAVEELQRLGVRRLKLPSGEITNRPLLQRAAATRLPLLLSTGMATLDEVADALHWIDEVWRHGSAPRAAPPLAHPLVLLHCTSAYPAPDESLNLLALPQLAAHCRVAVGYSDHSLGNTAALAAVALGAVAVEKHITVDRRLPGPDHAASSEIPEFAELVRELRRLPQMLGDGIKSPQPQELQARELARRSVVLGSPRAAGSVLERADLQLRRPGSGIAPRDLDAVVGRRLARELPAGHVLQWSDLLPGGDG